MVHPHFVDGRAVALTVKNLQRVQKKSGKWEGAVPFSQTVNALAHLDSTLASAQLDKAFNKLVAVQKRDGSWSADQPEWHTFLVIHALRNMDRI